MPIIAYKAITKRASAFTCFPIRVFEYYKIPIKSIVASTKSIGAFTWNISNYQEFILAKVHLDQYDVLCLWCISISFLYRSDKY